MFIPHTHFHQGPDFCLPSADFALCPPLASLSHQQLRHWSCSSFSQAENSAITFSLGSREEHNGSPGLPIHLEGMPQTIPVACGWNTPQRLINPEMWVSDGSSLQLQDSVGWVGIPCLYGDREGRPPLAMYFCLGKSSLLRILAKGHCVSK